MCYLRGGESRQRAQHVRRVNGECQWLLGQDLSGVTKKLSGKDTKSERWGGTMSWVHILALPLFKSLPLDKLLTFSQLHFLYKYR